MKRVWAVNHYWRFNSYDPESYGDSKDGFDRVAVFFSEKEADEFVKKYNNPRSEVQYYDNDPEDPMGILDFGSLAMVGIDVFDENEAPEFVWSGNELVRLCKDV